MHDHKCGEVEVQTCQEQRTVMTRAVTLKKHIQEARRSYVFTLRDWVCRYVLTGKIFLWWHTRVLSCSSRLSQASSFLCASLHKQHGEQEGVVHDGERLGSPARVMSFSSAVRRRSSLEEHDERDRSGSAPIFLCPRASINDDWRQWVPLRTSCRDGRRRTLAS